MAAIIGLGALLGGVGAAYAAMPWATDITIEPQPSQTRFTLQLTQELPFQVFAMRDPYRVVIDLPSLAWQVTADDAGAHGGVIERLHYGALKAGGFRITIDVAQPVLVQSDMAVAPNSARLYQLMLDITPVSVAEFNRAYAVSPRAAAGSGLLSAIPSSPAPATPVPETPAPDTSAPETSDQATSAPAIAAAEPSAPPTAATPPPATPTPAPPAVAAVTPPPAAPAPVTPTPATPAPPSVAAATPPPAAPPPVTPTPAPPAPASVTAAIPPPAAPALATPAPATPAAAKPSPSKPAAPTVATAPPTPLVHPPATPPLSTPPPATPAPATPAAAKPPLAKPAMPTAAMAAPVAAEPSMPSLPVAPVTVADVPALAMVPAPAPYHRPRGAKRVVVIDPGHGGIDPGATGVSGVHEKDITLAAARELKRQIDLGGHFRAVLTRTQDSFLPLRERVAIARANHADLFISLHADSIEAKGVSGSSVYTLSDRASDSEAAQLAAKENKADAIAGADLNAYPEEVAGILIDLAQRETRNDSNKYAHTLVVQLDQSGRVLEHSVRSAGFAVLKAPDVPSVLLEMGYLSNPNEERELRDPRYRAKLMGAIKRAIELYFAALDRMTRS